MVRDVLVTGVVVHIDCPPRALELPHGFPVRAVCFWTPVTALPTYARQWVDPCLMAVMEDASRKGAERICWRTGVFPTLVERIRAGDAFGLEGEALDRAPLFLARMAKLIIADAAGQIRKRSGDPTARLGTDGAPLQIELHRGSLL